MYISLCSNSLLWNTFPIFEYLQSFIIKLSASVLKLVINQSFIFCRPHCQCKYKHVVYMVVYCVRARDHPQLRSLFTLNSRERRKKVYLIFFSIFQWFTLSRIVTEITTNFLFLKPFPDCCSFSEECLKNDVGRHWSRRNVLKAYFIVKKWYSLG